MDLALVYALDPEKENNMQEIGGPGIRTQVLKHFPPAPITSGLRVLFVHINNNNNDNIQ